MPRKNALISVARNDAGILTFTVGDAGSFDLNPDGLSDEIKSLATVHGLVQKVSDAAAMPKSELSGNAKKDAKTKYEAMKSVADRLANGEWSKRRGDGTGPVAGILFRAFEAWVSQKLTAAKKPVPSTEQIREKWDAMPKSEQFAFRNDKDFAAIMDTLRAEKTSKVDTKALLAEFGL